VGQAQVAEEAQLEVGPVDDDVLRIVAGQVGQHDLGVEPLDGRDQHPGTGWMLQRLLDLSDEDAGPYLESVAAAHSPQSQFRG
jgi:hypothetical protein